MATRQLADKVTSDNHSNEYPDDIARFVKLLVEYIDNRHG
jgi:hypothetical protein